MLFAIIFIIGCIVGILLSTLFVATLALFKKNIVQTVDNAIRTLESVGPQQRGFILEPDDDATQIRKKIIEENNIQGKDTPLSDLM